MKQTPIIMSGNHPKLVMDGIKTQTRRTSGLNEINKNPDNWRVTTTTLDPGIFTFYDWKQRSRPDVEIKKIKCPYGQVGSRLWVRETHYRYGRYAKNGFTKTGKQAWKFIGTTDQVRYMDNPPEKLWAGWTREQLSSKAYSDWYKRPSIHMPRWASRITLEITEVRVERVQEITWDDTHKEGILRFDRDNPDPSNGGGMGYNRGAEGLPERYESITAFMDLWDSLNAKYGWEVNPFVWVISFKKED